MATLASSGSSVISIRWAAKSNGQWRCAGKAESGRYIRLDNDCEATDSGVTFVILGSVDDGAKQTSEGLCCC